ncbi:MAG: tyrosine-type recombinase/integrase [Chromatiales bacterium]|nr:tyrosine-type recombinase/integrase [Chromatiales bacterium]
MGAAGARQTAVQPHREDCILYETFLADPQPRERWCGQKAPRSQPPLAAASRHRSAPRQPRIRPCRSSTPCSGYLVKAGYLAGNPLALARRRGRGHQPMRQVERFLEHDQWQALLATVDELPRDSERDRQHHARARYLVALLYLLGPRVSEVAGHAMSSFVQIRGRWWWRVVGKGRKEAQVPVNQDMLQALRDYRRFYGLPPLPAPDEATPLVLNLKGTGGIGDNMIYRIVKDLVAKAAARLEADDPHQADKLAALPPTGSATPASPIRPTPESTFNSCSATPATPASTPPACTCTPRKRNGMKPWNVIASRNKAPLAESR